MTRFARAKGSKSSNERTPADSTPWEVMKEQLLQSKKEKDEAGKRQEAENQRIKNYENFLKEHKVSKRQATWCDFPEAGPAKKLLKPDYIQEQSKKLVNNTESETVTEKEVSQTKNKEKKKKQTEISVTGNSSNVHVEEHPQQADKKPKKKNKKKKNTNTDLSASHAETAIEANPAPISSNKGKKPNQFPQNAGPKKNVDKKKKIKLVNGKPNRRKELDNSFQLIINGKEVELIRFEGFPIMKKDAERLRELRISMIKKGIPKSEVQRTMKLERRRAEKALARVKREVCYNCRKGGHNLSDCPDLKSKIPGVDAADGVCFKCGSTEHRQFECKVQRDGEFRFATCFICREQGHLARQCPDNPKGLYPNGGSCKLCGDVTHLRKDCPTVQGQKEENSLKLDTLQSADNIEDIVIPPKTASSLDSAKKQPKKIRF